jgi:hypothetical protein
MWSFCSTDSDIRLIGEGGNNRIYKLNREYCGYSSAVIRVSKRCSEKSVLSTIQNYNLLKRLNINTTVFLEKCTFDDRPSLITEDLHKDSYTYLDANAHILRDVDIQLRSLDVGKNTNYKEPEEERRFADNKFKGITNLSDFIQRHFELLKSLAYEHLYIARDCYFFRVNRHPYTELDYIIADWDDIVIYNDENNLININIGQFKEALLQFVDKYVECDTYDYKGVIDRVFSEWNQ